MADHPFTEDQTLHGLLGAIAAREPDRPALVDLESRLTFGEVWERTGRLAARLVAEGVKPGDRVVVALPRSVDTVIGCFAILRAGAVILPIDLRQPTARNRALVHAACSRWALFQGPRPPECVDHIPTIQMKEETISCLEGEVTAHAGDDACLIFTSGSTGEAKGVRLSHAALVTRSGVERREYGFTSTDVFLLLTSPAFVRLPVGLTLLASGMTTAVAGEDVDDPEGLVGFMAALGVTFGLLAPRLVEGLTTCPDLAARLPALRLLRSAGEALPLEVASRFGAVMPHTRLVEGYGTTETSGVIASSEVAGWISGDVASGFVPLESVSLRVVASDRQPATEGEIWVSTPMLATGYLNGDASNDPKFIDEAPADGGPALRWYRTGDRGSLSPTGRLTVLGRMDLQLNVDGVRAEPKEIEDALRLHPSVADAAVRTHRDASGRERLIAYMVDRAEPASAAVLRTHLSQSLPSTLIPSRFVRMDALPLTASGKVDRASLPDPMRAAPSGKPPANEDETRLLALFREILRQPDLGVDDDFFEWGGDSLKSVALMTRVDEEMGIRLSAAALLSAPTVSALAEVVARGTPAEVATVWLRRQGDLPPLVCLPGLAGDPMWFFPLIEALDRRRPLLGLSFVGLKPPITIPSAAARAVESVRAIQPRGPYWLLGHSVGGVLAFEMARQLHADGESVAFIGLIDTFVPGKPHPQPSPERHRLRRARNRLLAAARAKEGRPSPPVDNHGRPAAYVPALRIAAQKHRVDPSDLAVTLFRASERSVDADLPGDWKPLAHRGVEVVDVPGHHFDMVGAGRAKELSARIVEALSRATSGLRASSSPSL